MDAIITNLRRKSQKHPENALLREILSHLSQLQSRAGDSNDGMVDWDILRDDLTRLTAEGLLEPKEHDVLLKELRMMHGPANASVSNPSAHSSLSETAHPASEEAQKISIVMPPPISTPLLPVSVNTTVLPLELLDMLNHVYFLHFLATEPERVLPPGKSLISVMSRPGVQAPQGPLPSLQERVENLVHKAFWDEALEALSNPVPSVEMPRLKRLYEDLYDALKPLLPAGHPILITLSSPLSPTSSPLRSAITHLREILACLRERCAPARDGDIDMLMHELDNVSTITAAPDLAKIIIETVRSTLKLGEDMKEDLSQFVFGTMGEAQLRAIVSTEARKRERMLVFELWSPPRAQELWQQWLARPLPPDFQSVVSDHGARSAWVVQLVHALGSTVPVSCPMPTVPLPSSPPPEEAPPTATNTLPPPLFFLCPSLLYMQNYLQALVIAASLRSLVRLPAAGATPSPADGFTARVWALLEAEFDEEPSASSTKLINLADEVVRVRQLCGGGEHVGMDEEARVRAAVDRTLQPHDPVFLLLQKRLLLAVAVRLCSLAPSPAGVMTAGPERLQAGRGHAGSRPRVEMHVDVDTVQHERHVQEYPLAVRGFEDEVLVRAVGEALPKLRLYVEWTEQTWRDLIERGECDVTF